MTDYLNLIVEVAVTVYVFLLGLPLLVNQILLPEDLRRFSRKNYTGKLWWHLGILSFLLLAIVAIAFLGNKKIGDAFGWTGFYPEISTVLFVLMLFETLRFLFNKLIKSQGNRANIVGIIKKQTIKEFHKTKNLDNHFMADLEYLGIYSKGGGETKFVLEALSDLLDVILERPVSEIKSQHINQIIDILCNAVTGSVEPGSRRNMEDVLTIYKGLMMWLEEIPPELADLNLNDVAPKLQKCTTKIALVSLKKEYTDLMPRILNVITMLARPSGKLFDIGVLALEREQFLIATNVLSELLDIDNKDKFTIANYYGLLAHFYDAGATARKHALRSLENNSEKLKGKNLEEVINYHYSSAHFKTVDKLNLLKKALSVRA